MKPIGNHLTFPVIYSLNLTPPIPSVPGPAFPHASYPPSMFFHRISKSFMFSTVPSRLLQKMKWAEDIAYMKKKENVYGGLVGKPEGDRPLGRP